MSTELKVGDEVVGTPVSPMLYRLIGKIVKLDTPEFLGDDETVLVEFYNWTGGHSGGMLDDNLSRYWCIPEEVKKLEPINTAHPDVHILPTTAEDRKNIPLMTGVVDYFTAALIEVAKVSKTGNDQHNPGQPLGWDRSKSTDHADCAMRHLAERGTFDTDGRRHTAKAAWRILAELQVELERDGAPVSRGSRFPQEEI